MTNKFLSRYADVVATSFPKMEIKNKKVVYTGNPVGDSSFDIKFNKKELGLSSKRN
jgi:UDP-N-acetylglucosamine:LPS N-acetylglucosamine transferase